MTVDLARAADQEIREGRMDMTSTALKFPKPEKRYETEARKDRDDERKLEAWRASVYHRDRYRCRVCGRKVERSLKRIINRAEAHHIKSRSDWTVRHDRRNGLTCCPKDHDRLEANEIVIISQVSMQFEVDGALYINGDEPGLEFKPQ